jgi:hypothetical protein
MTLCFDHKEPSQTWGAVINKPHPSQFSEVNNMPIIKEISDGGPNPNTPTIDQMRESQLKGSTGTGFDESYADKMAARNHGTGKGEGSDEEFPRAADYKTGHGGFPWERP